MSQESETSDQKQFSRRSQIAMLVAVGVLLVVAPLVLVQLVARNDNELALRGGLKIEVDRGVHVYVGNKHVGTGPVELTWDDLLGAGEKQPLATPIRSDTPSPTTNGWGAVTAEALAGKGSQIIWRRVGMTASAQNLEPITSTWKQALLRRASGELDAVLLLDCEFRAQSGTWRRFLIPIRLRSETGGSHYFSDAASGGIRSASGGIIPGSSALWLVVRSKSQPPPDEFAREIENSGLWTPGRQIKE